MSMTKYWVGLACTVIPHAMDSLESAYMIFASILSREQNLSVQNCFVSRPGNTDVDTVLRYSSATICVDHSLPATLLSIHLPMGHWPLRKSMTLTQSMISCCVIDSVCDGRLIDDGTVGHASTARTKSSEG